MLRYFIAGNVWSVMVILLVLGRKAWRAGPTRYTFFGAGSLSPTEYNSVILFCITAAAIFFILAWRTTQEGKSHAKSNRPPAIS